VDAVFHAAGEAAIERMADWERSVHIYRAFRAEGPTGPAGPPGLAGQVAVSHQQQKED
jgi:hypothetical protein